MLRSSHLTYEQLILRSLATIYSDMYCSNDATPIAIGGCHDAAAGGWNSVSVDCQDDPVLDLSVGLTHATIEALEAVEDHLSSIPSDQSPPDGQTRRGIHKRRSDLSRAKLRRDGDY